MRLLAVLVTPMHGHDKRVLQLVLRMRMMSLLVVMVAIGNGYQGNLGHSASLLVPLLRFFFVASAFMHLHH